MLPEGQIIYLGRIDRHVKIRGFRVEPGEIEMTALLHDRIKACAVVVSKDADDNPKTTAFIVPKDRNILDFDDKDLKAWMLRKLPEYMVPSSLIAVNALPQNASGKIDYQALKKTIPETNEFKPDDRPDAGVFLEENPCRDENEFKDAYEEKLKTIWEDILKTQAFSATDNFFEIGGSSLTAIRLVTAIEKKFSISIPILAVFKFPVLRKLAHVLRENDANFHFTNIKAIREDGDKPPIFFIAGTNEDTQAYQHQDLKGHPFYTVTVFAHKTVNNLIVPMDLWEIASQNVREIIQAKPS